MKIITNDSLKLRKDMYKTYAFFFLLEQFEQKKIIEF